MAYKQYSTQAYTGANEDVKHRISSNSLAPNADNIQFPNKFDLFVNKENAAATDFTVVEEHALGDFVGSTLYLDHRPATDLSGNVGTFTSTDGVIDTNAVDTFGKTLVFSTLPTADKFSITYTARGDKIENSHVNALQNAVMALQDTLGLKAPVSGEGSGIASLPLVTTLELGELSELQAVQDYLPNVVLLGHLSSDIRIASTNDPHLPSNDVTITIGNTGANTRDTVVIDADYLTVQATNTANEHSLPSGRFTYSKNTGDWVGFSGTTEFASQVTIGKSWGAKIDSFNDSVPGNLTTFYNQAGLRVHGGLWFNSGISGVGDITFVTTTGQEVEIIGALHATTLLVDSTATFNGPVTFNDTVNILSPGKLVTNNDIVMNPKDDAHPSKIDGLDASYAKASLEHAPVLKATMTHSVRHLKTEDHDNPYSQNKKHHPQLGFDMYPVVGGWTFTGKVNFEKAQSGQHHNIVLLDCEIPAIGFNYPNGGADNYNLGGGSLNYGSYCTGLFNPGDTFIEFSLGVNNNNNYSFPIYYHTPEGSIVQNNLTGLNVYIAADDDCFEDSTVLAGKTWRIYQPGNVPLDHLRADSDSSFSSSTAPVVRLGNQVTTDYGNMDITMLTEAAWDGNTQVKEQKPVTKLLTAGNYVSVDITDALTKSIDGISASAANPGTGVAYVYATTRPLRESTLEETIQLRATPTPYGLASQFVWKNGFNIRPGQHCPVGEVWASTTDGSNWTLVESVSYRPDAYYDSGWIPMVEYYSNRSPQGSPPTNLGRCLPIFNTSDTASTPEYVTDEEDHNFFIEHNIGPLRGGLVDVDFKVWVARYKTSVYTEPQATHMDEDGQALYKQTSAGDMNLWTPYAMPYHASHEFAGVHGGDPGRLRDITEQVRMRMYDSRFARFSLNDDGIDPIENYQYIRVYIRRIR